MDEIIIAPPQPIEIPIIPPVIDIPPQPPVSQPIIIQEQDFLQEGEFEDLNKNL